MTTDISDNGASLHANDSGKTKEQAIRKLPGAGKTTLLEHILKSNEHGLKIAVIVNDMAPINIDASLIAKHRVTQKNEKVIQMQNGCICCTLREDLLEEVVELARNEEIGYLLIESTGISEPMQVAEAFTSDFWEMLQAAKQEEEQNAATTKDGKAGTDTMEVESKIAPELLSVLQKGGLGELTELDCTVTVIDAVSFFDNFDTAEMLTDRYGPDVDPEDERNITELMIDQIEFANRIIINKIDMVAKETLDRIYGLIAKLNPTAVVIPSKFCKIDVTKIVNTKSFDFTQAATSAGWLRSLTEAPKPETDEYGVNSFVYRRRRPFHPERLYKTILPYFVLIQDTYEPDEGLGNDDEGDEMDDADYDDDEAGSGEDSGEEDEEMHDGEEPVDLQAKLAAKKANPLLKGLLRSKGFIWLATRPGEYGEWSQAGGLLTISAGAPWFCTVPEDEWPFEHEEAVTEVKKDFEGPWGDRRQELVFIGERLDAEALTAELDRCLVTDEEWRRVEKVMKGKKGTWKEKSAKLMTIFMDGFESWSLPDYPPPNPHAGHSHGGKKHGQKQSAEIVAV